METIESIIDWQIKTFGVGNPARLIQRVEEEWLELQAVKADPSKAAIEAADVIITLVGFLAACGHPNAIEDKMWVNRRRNWMIQRDGTGYHTEG